VVIGCCLGYLLRRFFERVPTQNPILKSLILSVVALGIGLILVQVGASRTGNALHIFLIDAVLNGPRFLALGVVVGYSCERLEGLESAEK
jgi:NhaP-type Na+/H+ or K+/H+ antiporter